METIGLPLILGPFFLSSYCAGCLAPCGVADWLLAEIYWLWWCFCVMGKSACAVTPRLPLLVLPAPSVHVRPVLAVLATASTV